MSESTTAFSPGEKVRIVADDELHRFPIGSVVTVLRQYDATSRFWYVTNGEDVPFSAPWTPSDHVGVKVRLVDATDLAKIEPEWPCVGAKAVIIGDSNTHSFPIGSTVTLLENLADYWLATRGGAGVPAVWTPHYDQMDSVRSVYPRDFKPLDKVEETTSPAEDTSGLVTWINELDRDKAALILEKAAMEIRAVDAERALAEFKETVRDAVVSEAEDRDWCDEVNGWLEKLGLEAMWPEGFPRDQHSLIALNDGGFAVREDTDNSPWKAWDADGEPYRGQTWWSDIDIARHYRLTLRHS